MKHNYLCKHPFLLPIRFLTDHKPLTDFLTPELHEGIYGHWADQLRRLNVEIMHMPGHRNKVAHGLSRTLFDTEDCTASDQVSLIREEFNKQGPSRVWKDGKGGFEAYLASLYPSYQSKVREHATIDDLSVFCLEAASDVQDGPSCRTAYDSSVWFGDIYKYLANDSPNAPLPALLRKVFDCWLVRDVFWIHRSNYYSPCIPEQKVLSVLMEAHHQSGHRAKTGTMARLRGKC